MKILEAFLLGLIDLTRPNILNNFAMIWIYILMP